MNKSPKEIKKYCLDLIIRRVTVEKLIQRGEHFLKIYDTDEPNNAKFDFKDFHDNEFVIIESKTQASNSFVITTERLIVNYSNTHRIAYLKDIDDFTEEFLLNLDLESCNDFEILSLNTEEGVITLECLSGIPTLVVINCIQRLLRLYIFDHSK